MKIFLALLLLLTTACASTDKNYAAALAAYQSASQANALVLQEQIRGISTAVQQSNDPTSKSIGLMMLGNLRLPTMDVPRPPESDAYKWASLILPAATTLGMGYYTYRLGATQSDNAAAVAVSTNNAFLGMGNAIATAGTAGYPFVQAPGPVTTTTTTTSNTNTYTNSYNTTRNCNAGNGGAATTTAGSGGSANC
jgi:hypothetical protein